MQFSESCVGIAANCLANPDESAFLQKVLADALEDSGHKRLAVISRSGRFTSHDLERVVSGRGVTIEDLDSWTNYKPFWTLFPKTFTRLQTAELAAKAFLYDAAVYYLQENSDVVPQLCHVTHKRAFDGVRDRYAIFYDESAHYIDRNKAWQNLGLTAHLLGVSSTGASGDTFGGILRNQSIHIDHYLYSDVTILRDQVAAGFSNPTNPPSSAQSFLTYCLEGDEACNRELGIDFL